MPAGKLTDEQTVQLLRDAEKGDRTIQELCRQYGVSTTGERGRLRQQTAENARLLKLVGQLALENNAGVGADQKKH